MNVLDKHSDQQQLLHIPRDRVLAGNGNSRRRSSPKGTRLMRHVEIFHGRKNTTACSPLLRFHSQAGDRPRSLDTKAADPRNVSRRKKNLFRFFSGEIFAGRDDAFLTRCSNNRAVKEN